MKTLLIQILLFFSSLWLAQGQATQIYGTLDLKTGLFVSQQEDYIFHGKCALNPRVSPIQRSLEIATTKQTQNEDTQCNCNEEDSQRLKPHQTRFYIWIAISVVLTLFAGLMSGLTVGYLSINDLNLEIKIKSGTDKEIKAAK